MSGTPRVPRRLMTDDELRLAMAGEDIRNRSATEDFKAGPRFHVSREPRLFLPRAEPAPGRGPKPK